MPLPKNTSQLLLANVSLTQCEGSCTLCDGHFVPDISDGHPSRANPDDPVKVNSNMNNPNDISILSSGGDTSVTLNEPMPAFITVKRPSGNVKLFCALWTLLMTLFGMTSKLYGYLQVDASSQNKSYSLYTSFIQLFGILCLVCLMFLQWKQKTLNKNHLMYDPHNGSLYLKGGLIGFTLGTLTYNTLQLTQDIHLLSLHPDCGSVEYALFHTISFAYNVLQCILLLAFSKVTFTYRPNVSLLCLAHLVAVCLHSWFSYVADEFIESIDMESSETEAERKDMCEGLVGNSTAHEMIEDTEMFLFPMAIELYLIAGGFFAIMSSNVGHPHVVKDPHKQVVFGHVHKAEWNSKFFTQETTTGFIFGTLLVVFTVVLIALKELYHEDYAILPVLFHWFIFAVNIIMIVCMYFIHKALSTREVNKQFHNRIDAPLLFVSLSGITVYSLFSVFAAIHGMDWKSLERNDAAGTLAGYLSHNVQSVIQTCFLLDAMRRKAARSDSSRNLLLVVLCGNIALWVTQMFELDFEDVNPMQVHLYGTSHWTLISHLLGPLAIFFRFHSAACVFDVWHTSYKRHESQRMKMKNLSKSPKNSKILEPKLDARKDSQQNNNYILTTPQGNVVEVHPEYLLTGNKFVPGCHRVIPNDLYLTSKPPGKIPPLRAKPDKNVENGFKSRKYSETPI